MKKKTKHSEANIQDIFSNVGWDDFLKHYTKTKSIKKDVWYIEELLFIKNKDKQHSKCRKTSPKLGSDICNTLSENVEFGI